MLRLAAPKLTGRHQLVVAMDVTKVAGVVNAASEVSKDRHRIFVCPSENSAAVIARSGQYVAAMNVPVYARFMSGWARRDRVWDAWKAKDRKAAAAIPIRWSTT
jgi:hypothetical protein